MFDIFEGPSENREPA